MPSWNIHTAHVEHLLEGGRAQGLGVADANAFLFGNYVPDVYVGFMVPDATMRIDYRITHMAAGSLIPVPDADRFWDGYIAHARPMSGSAFSLTLGAWAHILTDRFYNGNFREFWRAHDVPQGDELRVCKQADFDLFGRTFGIASHVRPTPELLEAAREFGPYSILPEDVDRSICVADAIVADSARAPEERPYRLLDEDWLGAVFDACDERLTAWLSAWQRLVARGASVSAAEIRAEAGLAPATSDDPDWMRIRTVA